MFGPITIPYESVMLLNECKFKDGHAFEDVEMAIAEVCSKTGEYFKEMTRAKTKTFIRRKLESKEDWWLTSEEAITYGFIDGVLGSEKFKSINGIRDALV